MRRKVFDKLPIWKNGSDLFLSNKKTKNKKQRPDLTSKKPRNTEGHHDVNDSSDEESKSEEGDNDEDKYEDANSDVGLYDGIDFVWTITDLFFFSFLLLSRNR